MNIEYKALHIFSTAIDKFGYCYVIQILKEMYDVVNAIMHNLKEMNEYLASYSTQNPFSQLTAKDMTEASYMSQDIHCLGLHHCIWIMQHYICCRVHCSDLILWAVNITNRSRWGHRKPRVLQNNILSYMPTSENQWNSLDNKRVIMNLTTAGRRAWSS